MTKEKNAENPLDKELGQAVKLIVSPETTMQRQRLAHTHRDFTVGASACITIDEFLQGLVPPLKATGRPLYNRFRNLTNFSMNVYDSSQSASGHLVNAALEHLSPGLVRMPPLAGPVPPSFSSPLEETPPDRVDDRGKPSKKRR